MTDEVKGERKKKTEEEETAAVAADFLLRPFDRLRASGDRMAAEGDRIKRQVGNSIDRG